MDCLIAELPPHTLYSLRQTNTEFHNAITDDVIKRAGIKAINQQLYKIFGIKTEAFKTLLCKSGAVISGSFIIQCLLGEIWNNSDIDVFVSTQHIDALELIHGKLYTDLEKFVYGMGMKCNFTHNAKTYNEDLECDNVKIKYVSEYETYPEITNILHTDKYKHPYTSDKIMILGKIIRDQFDICIFDHNVNSIDDIEKLYEKLLYKNKIGKIQIIQVGIEHGDINAAVGCCAKDFMYEYIQKSFDFDICKNVYCVESVGVSCGTDDGKVKFKDVLEVLDLKQMMSQCIQFKFKNYKNMRNDKTLERAIKYKARGFHIVNHLSLEEVYKHVGEYSDGHYVARLYAQL